jgi:hypothetical protein
LIKVQKEKEDAEKKEQELRLKRQHALKSLEEQITEQLKHRRKGQKPHEIDKNKLQKAEIEKRTNQIIAKILAENEALDKVNKPCVRLLKKNKLERLEGIPKSPIEIEVSQAETNLIAPEFPMLLSKDSKRHIPPMKPIPSIMQVAVEEKSTPISFRASPHHIIFKDYVPGRTYSQNLVFTNVSSFMNQFKVTSVAIEISQVVKIFHSQSIKVGMGGCCNVKIIFTPPSDFSVEIYNALVHFETSLGERVTVKVSLLKPKCIPIVSCVGGKQNNTVIFDNSRGQYTNFDRLVGKSYHSVENMAKLCTDSNKLCLDFGVCVLGGRKF